MNANDTNKVISALQSFADRLKNDPVAGTIYEGDWDTLIDAQTYLHQQQAEIEALKETLQGRDRYIDLLMEAQEK